MPLFAGDKLGPYEILAPIGAGGMGEVYRAHDSRLNRDVAIKVSNAQFTDFNDALPIIQQLIDGIEAAHERNIVHRDLKPANIKITPEGVVKILDFGLAKAMEPPPSSEGNPENSPTLTMGVTQAGAILGTAAYMAPEQAKGKAADRRSDIWSFGVILYEVLTGKRLFQGESAVEILGGVLNKEPDLSEAPKRVHKLLRWCLEKDRKDRLQSIGDARRLLVEDTATASPVIEASPIRKHPLVWALALIGGDWDIYSQPADGSRPAEALLKRPYDQTPLSISADGTLLYREIHPKTGDDLWTLSPDGKTSPLRVTPFNESAGQFSPGASSGSGGGPRWIAYTSDESGRNEIYVQSYPGGANRIPVSTGGGFLPKWSRDGKELFYVTGDAVVAVAIRQDGSFGAPRKLFDRSSFFFSTRFQSYDVSPDGKRFLMIQRDPGSVPRQLNVILNWSDEPDRQAPAGNK
jgi:serine/threonine protein kinase